MEIEYKREKWHTVAELVDLIKHWQKEGFDMIDCEKPDVVFRKVSRTNETK